MSLEHLEQLLREHIGLDTDTIGRHVLEHAVDLRRCKLDLPTREAYIQTAATDTLEWDELVELLVVPETWFFRGEMTYDFLRHFVRTDPHLSQPHSVLRILSAPCSTGEEPYSIVMSLFHDGWPADRLVVEGIDLSQRSLAFAGKAHYGARSFREKTPLANACLNRFFTEEDGMRQLSPEIRNAVRFRHVNVASPAFTAATLTAGIGRYDIIFCRNLMIYLHDAERRRLCDSLLHMLRPGGVVFAGHADPISRIDPRFEIVQPIGAFMYRCASESDRNTTTTDRRTSTIKSSDSTATRPSGLRLTKPSKKIVEKPNPTKSTPATVSAQTELQRETKRPSRRVSTAGFTENNPAQTSPAIAAPDAISSHSPDSVPPSSSGASSSLTDLGPIQKPGQTRPAPGNQSPAPAVTNSKDVLAEAIEAANQGDFGKATERCRQYLETTPQNAAAYCLLGLILQSQQQFDEARALYERALYLDPDHTESLTHLMLDAQRLGDRVAAENYARRLRRLQEKLLATEQISGGSRS